MTLIKLIISTENVIRLVRWELTSELQWDCTHILTGNPWSATGREGGRMPMISSADSNDLCCKINCVLHVSHNIKQELLFYLISVLSVWSFLWL
jgi:hypothetical protein